MFENLHCVGPMTKFILTTKMKKKNKCVVCKKVCNSTLRDVEFTEHAKMWTMFGCSLDDYICERCVVIADA